MNGAESAIRTALDCGVDVCFANPGTTEMHLVGALDAVPGMRAVLGLFEGVVTGAADGYGRMRDRPALTLTHLGPGFANGLANLHNARRAHTPTVNLIGDQATWHRAADAPLTSDIESLARPMSCWVRTSKSAGEVGRDVADAIAASCSAPGGGATLVIPADCAWGDAPGAARPVASDAPLAPPETEVARCAEALRGDGRSLILLGGRALREPGLRAAARVAAACGAELVCETFPARIERGAGLPNPGKLPYFPEQAVEFLGAFARVVLVGSRDPVAFFGYPGVPSRLVPDGCELLDLADVGDDAVAALDALAAALGAGRDAPAPAAAAPAAAAAGALDPSKLGAVVAGALPEHAIVVDEAATSGLPFWFASAAAPPHSYLGLTGGAIGQGIPCATGAAVACPDRRVVSLQADGSGMYTVQGLWTQARESLDVTTIVCSNRQYRILRVELARADISEPGPAARDLTDLGRPDLDWVSLARGLGVPASRAETAEELQNALHRALAEPGPALIEAVLP